MCDASIVHLLALYRGYFCLSLRQFYCVRAALLESIQAVVAVADHVLTGEGTVVLYFTYVLGLEHLLPDLNNMACSYL